MFLKNRKKIALLILVSIFQLGILKGQELINDRAQWFVDSRFGMFIHWGVYTGAEGFWKGEKLRYDNDYAEWILYRNRIDREEYLTLLNRFRWEDINPEEWVLLAKKAGMKYVTITAKHHDGFALWNSQASDYDVYDHTNPHRDIIKELSEACQKHGLKLGLYYSHWVDWEHPNGWDHSKEIYGISDEDYDQYWQEKVIPQMKELLTNYGSIGMIWFDMWIHHSKTVVTKSQLLQIKKMIRELQPECIINSRLGLSVEEDSDVDYQTLGDNQLGNKKKNYPWQTPATVAHSWGYHASDTEWKSTTTLLHSLINNVSLNGNLMLNIGPRANGEVPFEIRQRLLEMGQWLHINGESIYGSEAFSLSKDLHDWGRITYKQITKEKYRLYLHIYNWPADQQISLTGVSSKPENIHLLSDKQKAPLSFDFNEVVTNIKLPIDQPDPYVSVVVVEYSIQPSIMEDLIGKSVSGGYMLTPGKTSSLNEEVKIRRPGKFGSIPEHVIVEKELNLSWKLYIDDPGIYKVDASYSFQGKNGAGELTLKSGESTLEHEIQPTGKYVGEPNSNWEIESFNSNRIGEIKVLEKGFVELQLIIKPKKDGPVNFQWVWLQKSDQPINK